MLGHAATAINCRKSTSSCSQYWDIFCLRSLHLISSHSTSDDICQFRLPIIIFPPLRNKILWVWESSAICWKIATTCCMNERVLWDILTDNCYVLSLLLWCASARLPLFFFISTQLRLCVWNNSFPSSKKKWALRKWNNDSCVNFLFKYKFFFWVVNARCCSVCWKNIYLFCGLSNTIS